MKTTSNITLHNYIRQDNGQGILTYTLLPETLANHSKKRTAGLPKTITLHMPTTKEGIKKLDNTYIKYAEKAAAKSLGVN